MRVYISCSSGQRAVGDQIFRTVAGKLTRAHTLESSANAQSLHDAAGRPPDVVFAVLGPGSSGDRSGGAGEGASSLLLVGPVLAAMEVASPPEPEPFAGSTTDLEELLTVFRDSAARSKKERVLSIAKRAGQVLVVLAFGGAAGAGGTMLHYEQRANVNSGQQANTNSGQQANTNVVATGSAVVAAHGSRIDQNQRTDTTSINMPSPCNTGAVATSASANPQ